MGKPDPGVIINADEFSVYLTLRDEEYACC